MWELRLKGICREELGIWHWAELGTSLGMLGTEALLGLFSSPDLFAIHADSTHGCGLSPVAGAQSHEVVVWNCVVPAWVDAM